MRYLLFAIIFVSTPALALVQDGEITHAKLHSSIKQSTDAMNCAFTTTVAGAALTIAVKDAAGNNPSITSPCKVSFRHATLTNGTFTQVSVTSALSMVVSSGSTLGHTSAVADNIHVYLINNSGTAEVAVSSSRFNDAGVITTTAEGGAGGADSGTVMYSTTARTTVPFRILGRIRISEATAGTWTSNATELALAPIRPYLPKGTICCAYNNDAAGTPVALNETCSDGEAVDWVASATRSTTGLFLYTLNDVFDGIPIYSGGGPVNQGATSGRNVMTSINTTTNYSRTAIQIGVMNGASTATNVDHFFCVMKGSD